ncbi:MAG: tetratricopeptide repeat protein, partial [Nannocystaceae bacterium]|nr:tetratricopeptide repeat protein [Nannocystaceae bacterium]
GEVGEEFPPSPARHNVLLMARARREYNVGALNYWLDRHEPGLAAFQRSVAATEAARGVDHLDTLDGLEGVAMTADGVGDLELARVSAESRVRILKKHRGKNHPSVGAALQTLASIHYSLGDLDEVRRLYERSIAVLEDHKEPGFELRLASARVQLTAVLRELGEIDTAMKQATLAYAGFEDGTDPSYAGGRAGALRELALLHSALGEHEDAVEFMERAYVAGRDSEEERVHRVAFAVAQVHVFNEAGRYRDAVVAGEAGMEHAADSVDAVDTMLLQLRLAEALAHRGAEGDSERALSTLDSVETKARRVGAGVILDRDLPESRAEVLALRETR